MKLSPFSMKWEIMGMCSREGTKYKYGFKKSILSTKCALDLNVELTWGPRCVWQWFPIHSGVYVQAMSSWAPHSVILMAWIEDGALGMLSEGNSWAYSGASEGGHQASNPAHKQCESSRPRRQGNIQKQHWCFRNLSGSGRWQRRRSWGEPNNSKLRDKDSTIKQNLKKQKGTVDQIMILLRHLSRHSPEALGPKWDKWVIFLEVITHTWVIMYERNLFKMKLKY